MIANRFRKVLPGMIDLDQKGFVDGRYMGEATRTLYDTIDDAFSNGKKGIILSVDFEKVFDSVSFSFMKKWIDILLKDFTAKIVLGRGARQGDPIASLLFVLAIEILLKPSKLGGGPRLWLRGSGGGGRED